jgi:hypothetical protein
LCRFPSQTHRASGGTIVVLATRVSDQDTNEKEDDQRQEGAREEIEVENVSFSDGRPRPWASVVVLVDNDVAVVGIPDNRDKWGEATITTTVFGIQWIASQRKIPSKEANLAVVGRHDFVWSL